MALIDTLKNIIEAEAGKPPATPTIHTPDSDRRMILAAINMEIMQARHNDAITTKMMAACVMSALGALGFEIKRKAES